MKILKINNNKPESSLISIAAEFLKQGKLIICPTDTLYALATSVIDKKCIRKVYEIKGRDYKKPLSIMFPSLSQAKKYFEFNEIAERISKKFLPGPLTIILHSKKLPKELSDSGRFSFRIPDNKVALKLLEEVDFPLTCTSANISGRENPIDADTAISHIGDKVGLILDCGKCKYGKPSTVIDLSDGKLSVVREGVISRKYLEKFI